MLRARTFGLAAGLWLAVTGAASAEPAPREVAAITLPSRDPGAAVLAARVRSLGAALARAQRATLLDSPGPATRTGDVAVTLARAQALADAASLDEAARILDAALEVAGRAPHHFADSDLLAAAALTRVSIALARGEAAVAEHWLERLLRWSPTLVLRPAEDTPRLRAALAAARARLGAQPALRPEDLGGLCAIDEVLVARVLGPAATEVQRRRGCRVVASVTVAEVDASVLGLLGVAAVATDDGAPVWRRGWFWVGVGVAASVAGVVAWRVAEPDDEVDVVPRF
jgi:hypothetical protein